MKIKYRKKFLQELVKVNQDYRKAIERFVFDEFPANPSIQFWDNIVPLKGENNLFKVLFDEYRIGIKRQADCLLFERVRHKNDIYSIKS